MISQATLSAEIRGQLTYPHDGRFGFECSFSGGVAVAFVWLDDHEVCVAGAYANGRLDRSSMDGSPSYPMIVDQSARANRVMNVRVQMWGNGSAAAMGLDVRWRDCGTATGTAWGGNCSGTAPAPIPAASLSTTLAPLEQRRRALQRPMLEQGGWGGWAPHNYLSLISLPDSARVSLMLCQLSTRR